MYLFWGFKNTDSVLFLERPTEPACRVILELKQATQEPSRPPGSLVVNVSFANYLPETASICYWFLVVVHAT